VPDAASACTVGIRQSNIGDRSSTVDLLVHAMHRVIINHAPARTVAIRKWLPDMMLDENCLFGT